MTYSKTAAIRTAIAVIAALIRVGCMSGGHGVKRMSRCCHEEARMFRFGRSSSLRIVSIAPPGFEGRNPMTSSSASAAFS